MNRNVSFFSIDSDLISGDFEEHTFYPAGNTPIAFTGKMVFSQQYSDDPDDCFDIGLGKIPNQKEDQTVPKELLIIFSLFITPQNKLIFIDESLSGFEEYDHDIVFIRKAKYFKTINDVWSVFEKQPTYYIHFLKEAAKILGDESMFWKKYD